MKTGFSLKVLRFYRDQLLDKRKEMKAAEELLAETKTWTEEEVKQLLLLITCEANRTHVGLAICDLELEQKKNAGAEPA